MPRYGLLLHEAGGRGVFEVDYLELAATLVTFACVVLGVKRSLWQFPVGIVGTALFFVVVWQRHLMANAALQIFFIGVQGYGWWYWMKGGPGHRPLIRATSPWILASAIIGALVVAVAAAPLLKALTPTTTPLVDGVVFTLSVVAQFLLDRKRIETWWVWTAVNILSVWLYASNGVWLFTGLYIFFFFNAFWGWWEWRQAMQRQSSSPTPSPVERASA
jgi:nicotinamide mononucleotide transporter